MNLCAVQPISPQTDRLLALCRQRGDAVAFARGDEPLPPADVTLCAAITGALSAIERGALMLDARPGVTEAVGQGAMFADVCLVSTEADRRRLVDEFSCEPARVFVAATDRRALEILDGAAQNTLPPAPPLARPPEAATPQPPDVALAHIRGRLRAIEQQADVVLRHYRVRSGVPVLGRLIVWLRQNLTSHLREPYLDPILDRQVSFNTQIARELQTLLTMQADLLDRVENLERAIQSEKDERE